MENLLLVSSISALPLACFIMVSRIMGNKLMGLIFLKLPSLIVLVTSILYLLKKLHVI